MNIFTIYIACTILPIVLFVIGLVAALVIQTQRGPTTESRAFARKFVSYAWLYSGLMLVLQNAYAIINPRSYEFLPTGAHIALIMVGVVMGVSGAIAYSRLPAKAKG